MSQNLGFKITGLSELLVKLDRLGKHEYLAALMEAVGSDLKDWIAECPPTSDANNPLGRTWYERGWGSRWRVKDGSIHGAHTSETLGRRWTTSSGPDWAKVGNNASYARYVQDAKYQTSFHARRGWRTVQGAIKAKGLEIRDKIKRALQAIIAGG
jgi:phage gpG-like protein